MDEPLSNLDAKLRVQMRAEIHQLQRRLDVTTIYVTHDQVEAMTMGDRVAVMNAGRLQQVDTPQVLYDHPSERVRRRLHRLSRHQPASRRSSSRDERSLLRQPSASIGWPSTISLARNRSGAERLRRSARSSSASGPRTSRTRASRRARPADRRMTVTCDLTEPLGAEVLIYFGTAATGVVSSAVTADAGEDAAVRLGGGEDDDGGKTRICRTCQPAHENRDRQQMPSSRSTRAASTSSTRRRGKRSSP